MLFHQLEEQNSIAQICAKEAQQCKDQEDGGTQGMKYNDFNFSRILPQPPIQVLNEMVGAGNVLSNTLPPSKDGFRMTTVEINVEVVEKEMAKVVFLQISGQDLYRHWTDAIDCEEHCSRSRRSSHRHHHEQRSHRGRGADWARL